MPVYSEWPGDPDFPRLPWSLAIYALAHVVTWGFAALTAWCLGVVVLRVVGR